MLCFVADPGTRRLAPWLAGGGEQEGPPVIMSGQVFRVSLHKIEPARKVPRCVMTCLHTCANIFKSSAVSTLPNYTNM